MILVHVGISGWKEIPGAALKLTAEITISTVQGVKFLFFPIFSYFSQHTPIFPIF